MQNDELDHAFEHLGRIIATEIISKEKVSNSSQLPGKSKQQGKTKPITAIPAIFLTVEEKLQPFVQDIGLEIVCSPVRTLPPRDKGGALVVWPGCSSEH